MLSGTHSMRSILNCGAIGYPDRERIRNVSNNMHGVEWRVKPARGPGRSPWLSPPPTNGFIRARANNSTPLSELLLGRGLKKAREKLATIRDVARVSGVSVGTVSRSLNAPDSVRPATL